jgi:site-specific recombinase XerD
MYWDGCGICFGKDAKPHDSVSRSAKSLFNLIRGKLDAAMFQIGGNGGLDMTNEELEQEYLESLQARLAESAYPGERSRVERFIRSLKGKPLIEIGPKEVRKFTNTLSQKNYAVGTIQKYISRIRGIFEHLNEIYGFDIPNLRSIRGSDYRSKVPCPYTREPLSREEVRELIQAADSVRDRLIIEIFHETGIRVRELSEIKLENVNQKTGGIWIDKAKGGSIGWVKYNPNRIGDLMDLYLRRERGNCPNASDSIYLFVSDSGKKLRVDQIRRIVHQAAVKAGIQKVMRKTTDKRKIYRVTPHLLRHCHATHAAQDHVPLDHIQRMLRQKNVNNTLIYVHEPLADSFISYDQKFRGVSTIENRRRSKREGEKRVEGGEEQ